MLTPKRQRERSSGNQTALTSVIMQMIALGQKRKFLQTYLVIVALEVNPMFSATKGRGCRM